MESLREVREGERRIPAFAVGVNSIRTIGMALLQFLRSTIQWEYLPCTRNEKCDHYALLNGGSL
jgi:hypothetical protein